MIFSDQNRNNLHKSTMMLKWMGLNVSSVGKFAMSISRLQECLHMSIESLYSSMESDTPPHRSDHRDQSGGKEGFRRRTCIAPGLCHPTSHYNPVKQQRIAIALPAPHHLPSSRVARQKTLKNCRAQNGSVFGSVPHALHSLKSDGLPIMQWLRRDAHPQGHTSEYGS